MTALTKKQEAFASLLTMKNSALESKDKQVLETATGAPWRAGTPPERPPLSGPAVHHAPDFHQGGPRLGQHFLPWNTVDIGDDAGQTLSGKLLGRLKGPRSSTASSGQDPIPACVSSVVCLLCVAIRENCVVRVVLPSRLDPNLSGGPMAHGDLDDRRLWSCHVASLLSSRSIGLGWNDENCARYR